MKKKTIEKWEAGLESGYDWPKPKRISVYIFDNQLRMLEEIGKEKGMRLRHIFFECFQWYIATELQNKEQSKNGKG